MNGRLGIILGGAALLLLGLVAASAFQRTPPEPNRSVRRVGGPIASCARYSDYPPAYDVCATEFARNMPAESMESACATVSAPSVCRSVWATSGIGSASATIERRIAACGNDEDCRFDILDHADAGTVDQQIDLCLQLVEKFADDCVGHVMERWRLHRPDTAEIARLTARTDVPFPAIVGQWVRTTIACDHVGECGADTPVALACLAFVVDPRACSTAKPPAPGPGDAPKPGRPGG